MSFAAGSLAEALAAVAAAHLDICPRCRRELKLMEQMGCRVVRRLALARARSTRARHGAPPTGG